MSATESLSGDGPDPSTDNTIHDPKSPSVTELEMTLESSKAQLNHIDEVWPNLYIGDLVIAHDKKQLRKMGITHVLNAAHSKWGSVGDQIFYGKKINYYGIAADDSPEFDLSAYFYTAAEQIHQTLNTPNEMDTLVSRSGLTRRKEEYEPPTISELNRLLWTKPGGSGHVDHVWPNLHLGDAWTARDKGTLRRLRITHVLNAADGKYNINTGATYYKDMRIHYYGVEAFDDPNFNLSPFFYPAAKFIRAGLNTLGGKVFVHCAMGISRAATLVLAYLMICEKMTLADAIKTVSAHRNISPNNGFLSQLQELDRALMKERRG